MKLRSGIWFAAGVAALLAVYFFGNEVYFRYAVAPIRYPRLEPGTVNLIGIAIPGYRIIVSNGIARLQQGGLDAFGKPEDVDATSGNIVPMRGLIGSLRFEPDAISELLTSFAAIKYEIEPDEKATWTKANLSKALSGDPALRGKLERDLCTRLDGRPVDSVSWGRLETGIWVRVPVEVHIPSATGTKPVTSEVTIPFQTRLAATTVGRIRPRLTGGRLEPDAPMLAGTYLEVSKTLGAEDVAAALGGLISDKKARKLAEPVETFLQGVVVLVTDAQMNAATLEEEPQPGGAGNLYTLGFEVTKDARNRLWQYTHGRTGTQLLLVWRDIAIAAPVIRHEIKYSKVTITNIADEDLARGPLEFVRRKSDNEQ